MAGGNGTGEHRMAPGGTGSAVPKGRSAGRLLIISPTPVAPLLGGASARVRTLIDALGVLGFEVHLAFVERDLGDNDAMRAMLGSRFHPIPYQAPRSERSMLTRIRRRIQKALRIEAGWLSGVDDLYDPGIEPELERLQAHFRFDVVMVEYVFFSRALKVFGPQVRKLIDMHDVFGNRHRQYVAAGQDHRWFSVRPAEEVRALRRADQVLAIQPDEARLMRKRGLENVASVSHIVSLAGAPGRVPDSPMVLFVGAGNEANALGLSWFVTRVWPLVIAKCPQARFHVVGSVSASCPVAPRVEPEGRVSPERLHALYGEARVAVNPVFAGSGQSIKVLEATGYGVPVVASAVGLRGIVGAQAPGIAQADDPADFASALVRLLDDAEHAARAREAAYAFARASNERQFETLLKACSGAADAAMDDGQQPVREEGSVVAEVEAGDEVIADHVPSGAGLASRQRLAM